MTGFVVLRDGQQVGGVLPATARSYWVANLLGDHPYTFGVKAVGAQGNGPVAEIRETTQVFPPGAPTAVTVSSQGRPTGQAPRQLDAGQPAQRQPGADQA